MKGQPLHRRVRFALAGLALAVRRERSLRTHLLATALVAGALLWLRPAPLWWALLAFAAGFVLVAELVNSALEALIDHLHPERHPEIGAIKDIAAAAVLVASTVALVVAAAFVVDRFAG